MRIGFDAKRAFFNKSGLGSYSRNLIQGLAKKYPENEYILYTPGTNPDLFEPLQECFNIKVPTAVLSSHIPVLLEMLFCFKTTATRQN